MPSRRTFKNVCDKLRRTGNLNIGRSDRQKREIHKGNKIDVLAIVYRDPHDNSRQIEREANVSKRSVLHILHRYKFHPYHLSFYQALHGMDFVNRFRFCQWALHQLRNNDSFFDIILFTDQATFTNHGNVNLRNMH